MTTMEERVGRAMHALALFDGVIACEADVLSLFATAFPELFDGRARLRGHARRPPQTKGGRSMTMEEKVDAAAREANSIWRTAEPWAICPDDIKAMLRQNATDTLKAAFPELFDGSAWIAPWDADEAMVMAFHASASSGTKLPAMSAWDAMRDAHLKPDAT